MENHEVWATTDWGILTSLKPGKSHEMTTYLHYLIFFIPLLMIDQRNNLPLQDPYIWKNRVIILRSDIPNSSKMEDQKAILNSDSTGLADRDLVIIDYSQAIKHQLLDDSLPLTTTQFRFYLRGKDGGIKFKSDTLVSPEYLYSIIDAMPMRKMEIRRNDQKKNP